MNPRESIGHLVACVLLAVAGCASSEGGSSKAAGTGDASASNGEAGASGTSPTGGNVGGGGSPAINVVLDAGVALSDASMGQGGASGGSTGAGGMTAAGGATSAGGSRSSSTGTGAMGGSIARPDAGAADVMASPAGDAYGPCAVTIVPSSSPSLFNLVPGDTATLAVKATVSWGSATVTQLTWQWIVKSPDGTPLAITTVPTSERNTASIQFPLLAPGIYDISVSATSSCKGHASATAVKPQERSQTYFLRILPPPTSLADSGQTCDNGPVRWCPSQDAVPYEDNNFVLQAGQPLNHEVQLLRGYVVSIDPVAGAQPDPKAFPAVAVPSYIRLAPHGSTWTLDGASTSDQPLRALLHPLLQYDVLVVPQIADTSETVLPPFRVASKLAQEFRPDDFNVPAGVTVRGTLRTADGPVVGGRLFLRAAATDPVTLPLPSTVGTSDATGTYSLRASPGALFSAVVMPPVGSSLPQVSIADCIDLGTVTNGTALTDVNFTWNTIGTTTLIVNVRMSDGSTPTGPIALRLQSQDGALPEPGILNVNGTLADVTSGSVRQDGTTDANGSITFAGIPKVAYHLALVPPSELTGAATTTADIDLSGAGNSFTRIVGLARKVRLSGRLLPASAAGGAQLVATDTGTDVLVSVISTPVASDGSYTFLADPGRTYRFSVEPAPGKNLPARIPLYGVATTDQDAQLANRTLPSGLKISGTIVFSGLPVGGAIVQAYCRQSGIAGCVDPNNPNPTLPPPLVESATLPDGSYSFYLPDPATGG